MKFFKTYILPLLILIVLVLLLRGFVVQKVRVSGDSMQPNLENNQKVIVFKLAPIKHLSVIVFNATGEDPTATTKDDYYVKRVIGLPGDKVSFENGNIYVNNKKVTQKFISNDQRNAGTETVPSEKNTNPNGVTVKQSATWNIHKLAQNWPSNTKAVKVPKGDYFVLGDHRSISNDSRYWGFVPKDKVLGVVHTFPWGTSAHKQTNVNSLGY